MAVITDLVAYFIKSCAATHLESAVVTSTGLAVATGNGNVGDRMYLLIDEHGRQVNQRLNDRYSPEHIYYAKADCGALALVQPRVEDDGSLYVSAPGMPVKKIEQVDTLDSRDVQVFSHQVHGRLVSPDVDKWFSDYLGMPVQLVKVREDDPGLIPEHYREYAVRFSDSSAEFKLGAADGGHMLLTSESSLRLLSAVAGEVFAMSRFRPNIVVDTFGKPFAEDKAKSIRIGEYQAVLTPCARCPMPDIDQDTGVGGRSVRSALGKLRSGAKADFDEKGVFFGQNLFSVDGIGETIRVNQSVVSTLRDEPNVVLNARCVELYNQLVP